jgi:NAD-dependent SIR2 family protein deacetylase
LSAWSRDFERTYAEYNGKLIERTCNYCGRDILSDERAKKHREYGRVCSECAETIREEERVWESD